MTRTFLKSVLTLSAVLFFNVNAHARRTSFEGFEPDFCMDMPEGFGITETGDNGNFFILESSAAPCKALIRIYQKDRFKTSKEALETTLKNLGITYECEEFIFHNDNAALAIISGTFLEQQISGYAGAVHVSSNGKFFVDMIWTAPENSERCNSFMTSFIDSLYMDELSYFDAGLLTQAIFPAEKKEVPLNLKIGGKEISTFIDASSRDAADYVVMREYEVLLFYQSSPLWQLAWQRYYRMIFRDSCTRLQQVSFDVYNALAPDCADETEYAQKLLNWTQEFEYAREKNAADFTSLPAVLLGEGSDCDSRSLLIAVMLQSMNIDSIIYVSAEYSHAIAGLNSTHPGFGFKTGETTYLTGDTTVKNLTWGKLSADIADAGRWIPVILP